MSETVQIRQENPEETENRASIEEPNNSVYGYLSRAIADQLGEFIELTISVEADAEATLDYVSGQGTGNYAVYETPGQNVVGFGIELDILEDVFDQEIERDDDDTVQNAPETVGLVFDESTEEDYDEAESADEEEADALLASDSEEDEVEIDNEEELNLVEG